MPSLFLQQISVSLRSIVVYAVLPTSTSALTGLAAT